MTVDIISLGFLNLNYSCPFLQKVWNINVKVISWIIIAFNLIFSVFIGKIQSLSLSQIDGSTRNVDSTVFLAIILDILANTFETTTGSPDRYIDLVR